METYYWKTEDYHHDNVITMMDYVLNHLPEEAEVVFDDGSYIEIVLESKKYGVCATGNGDSYNHKVEFGLIEN